MRNCVPLFAAPGKVVVCPSRHRTDPIDRRRCFWLLGAALAVGVLAGLPATSLGHSFYHEKVLGTSLHLHVESPSLETDREAEAAVLGEIARLSRVLSTYSDTSEFSQFLSGEKTPRKASQELVEVLRACDHWKAVSGGAFNPAAGLFGRLWSGSAEQNRLPSATELADAVRRAQRPAWEIDASGETITRRGDVPLSLNALAKGHIIDRACRAALADTPGVTGILLDIGGDLRVYGDAGKVIGVAEAGRAVHLGPRV